MRKIIHVDADSFYASVEMREDPRLKGLPVAVGGQPGKRGVIATCNYEARAFGVHSAMASSRAVRLCPQLIILRPRFELYRSVSKQIRAVFESVTDLIEPLSLDEAFLDVSNSNQCRGSATLIAKEIRKEIKKSLNLTVSAGVAPNKFLAKIASDWKKPDGLFVILPSQVVEFMTDLPVQKINGVGKVTTDKMHRLGIKTCGDLQGFSAHDLSNHFGSYGQRLYELARGIDERPVSISHERKSLSVERTFADDLTEPDEILQKVEGLCKELENRFSNINETYFVTKRFVKVKFNDFTQTTLEESLFDYSSSWLNQEEFSLMIRQAWERQRKPARLLGVGVRLHPKSDPIESVQLSLF